MLYFLVLQVSSLAQLAMSYLDDEGPASELVNGVPGVCRVPSIPEMLREVKSRLVAPISFVGSRSVLGYG